ncbi:MAG: GNAT family N-acetyltransferase [Thermoproteota archaeon]|uniref:GNAT family N-acetyltransferase n=1 Tax=Candidatus Methanodesulfokora washburnensis TaxID=2478471 RepID=A0A429GFM0_9CREN|nr:GNAT family N-acetyltransferase [Candidatus Methanodesulfokores washburnensis]RSN72569.1 GNAT family N-acetyltransferase [Candidatus Methanodesulfokores washburnensis]RZN61632.1 MAG: GNAT family N-acetyltransferase [Candidatus Methanodesulfokores washburnensis]TDA41525.1 MAG: GNAT family N-acetyltransferase [Candidatus Korarchaeota archaeon]
MRIEEVGEERLEEIIKLDEEVSWEFVDEKVKEELGYEEYAKRHRELFLELLRSPGEQRFFAALDENGDIVGVAWIKIIWDTVNYVKFPYLMDINIKEGYRGRGIGTMLLNAVEEFCKRKGYRKIGLRVESSREDLVNWYKKKGYIVKSLYMEKELK